MNGITPTVCGYQIRASPPPLFRLAELLNRWKLRGGYRLGTLASRGCVVEYDLGCGFRLTIPIYRADNRLSRDEILRYETNMLSVISEAARSMRDATLIDCGADIGMISVMLCRQLPAIGRVIAFEPNVDVLPFLSRNLSMLPCPSLLLGHAVGNYVGAGSMVRPAIDTSDHARFFMPDPAGGIRVITVDSLGLTGNMVMKIDVEGGEYAVIEGAVETIRQAPHCVVSLEAHSGVAQRTGHDPVESLRLLNSIRQFRFVVTSCTASWELTSLDQPIFLPSSALEILNVIASAVV